MAARVKQWHIVKRSKMCGDLVILMMNDTSLFVCFHFKTHRQQDFVNRL